MSDILIISNDVVGKNMSGPAIRSLAFAENLSRTHRVTLAAPTKGDIIRPTLNIIGDDRRSVSRAAMESHAIICQGDILDTHPSLYKLSVPLVIDLYDPVFLETLEIWSGLSLNERLMLPGMCLSRNKRHIKAGDFFMCASEKQRDFWLGILLAVGRINSYTYYHDRDLRKLIDVVSFGLPDERPVHNKKSLRGVCKEIEEGDKILLWNGGIWNWLDPITLIRAMEMIVRERSDVKLVFMGIKHPSPKVPEMEVCVEAIQLSKELGLFDKFIFFNEWVPYEERSNFLLESDFGVCLHKEHLETRFSFRTRVLDCIWTGLPIVISEGDYMSQLVKEKELGVVVPPGDVQALKDVLMRVLDDKELQDGFKSNISEVAPLFVWDKVLEPLRAFCDNPRRAPDKGRAIEFRLLAPRYYLSRFRYFCKKGGLRGALGQTFRFMRRRFPKR